jgi:hypothetical protein
MLIQQTSYFQSPHCRQHFGSKFDIQLYQNDEDVQDVFELDSVELLGALQSAFSRCDTFEGLTSFNDDPVTIIESEDAENFEIRSSEDSKLIEITVLNKDDWQISRVLGRLEQVLSSILEWSSMSNDKDDELDMDYTNGQPAPLDNTDEIDHAAGSSARVENEPPSGK